MCNVSRCNVAKKIIWDQLIIIMIIGFILNFYQMRSVSQKIERNWSEKERKWKMAHWHSSGDTIRASAGWKQKRIREWKWMKERERENELVGCDFILLNVSNENPILFEDFFFLQVFYGWKMCHISGSLLNSFHTNRDCLASVFVYPFSFRSYADTQIVYALGILKS